MKRVSVLLLTAAVLFSFASCGSNQLTIIRQEPIETSDTQNPADTGIVNPVVSYETIDEVNRIVGSLLTTADQPDEESFSVISGKTAQYQYTIGQVRYCYRASKTFDDISGVYLAGGAAFAPFVPGEEDPVSFVSDSQWKLARWFTDSQMQYVFAANDGGFLTEDEFRELAAALQEQTGVMLGYEFYDNLSGDYFDSTSQRATMEAVSAGYGGILLTVTWSESAEICHTWTMTARVSGKDGRLAYSDGIHRKSTFAEDGTEISETIRENIEGYFTLETETGSLLWTGGETDCRACVFERN